MQYSEVVYSKPLNFARKARVIGFKDECTGEKVNREELASKLVLAAISNLVDLNAATIKWAEGKGWGPFKKKGFVLIGNGRGNSDSGGLEGALLANAGKSSFLSDVVSKVVGGKRVDPHSEVIRIVEKGLAEKGKGTYKGRIRKKFQFNCEEPKDEELGRATSSMGNLRRSFPELEKEIKKCLRSLVDRSTDDFD